MEAGGRSSVLSVLFLAAVLFVSVCRISPAEIDPLVVEELLLWENEGMGEVNTYRIPLLTSTPSGSLLAFVEARKMFERDYGSKFIALRRSTDRGATWSPTSFIVDDVKLADGLNLGCVVVDHEKQLIFVIYTVCFHFTGCNTSSIMMIKSKNDGLSWSEPKNLSLQLGIKAFAPGPGFGIQKRYDPGKGRLVVCGHGTIEDDGVFCILSDDHGDTWYKGGALRSIPFNQKKKLYDFTPDEPQLVEMLDGSIIVNARNQNKFHCSCRVIVRSLDGGLTLPVEELYFDEGLIDPSVAAGVLQKEGVLYFTNPSSAFTRENLTLRWSLNNGTNWENKTLQIWPGPSCYSCMTSMDTSFVQDKEYIYVIYEKGHKKCDETISFVKIRLYKGL